MSDLPKIKTRSDTCAEHGDFESKNWIGSIWSKCPVCSKYAEAEARAATLEKEAKERLEAYQKRIGMSGIPPRFHDRSFTTFIANTREKKHALDVCAKFARDFDVNRGASLIFIGSPGTGKTHLACSIGLALLKDHKTVLFTTVQRAMRRVKDSWARSNPETEGQVIETLVEPDLLILDEVGVQYGSDFEKGILFDVLNERYEFRRPVILISNLTLDEVVGFLGERVYDRLREGKGLSVPFGWASFRKTGA